MNDTDLTPNRLINEKSPYLQQHAYNPVDWYPWGEEALDLAKKENKPIILSIGYSTCHWCHVMENESFADPKIASQMNANFVCIKVDREERPDLDKLYITAVTSLTGSAGWPLNVFLTPDLKPFFGGTYFPPQPKFGIAAWSQLLGLIANAWNDPDKRRRILDSADAITQTLNNHLSWKNKGIVPGPDLLETAYKNFASSFDATQGGFSPAPKFPSPAIQNFLLFYSQYAKNTQGTEPSADRALAMTVLTLRAMARGGIYDHLGGGFHRYATDDRWHVPHFEKMLYDNAQLMVNYLEAFQITRDDFFAEIAKETAGYILRDMTSPNGGFYAAEDADSFAETREDPPDVNVKRQKVEGAYYVWTLKEIEDILETAASNMFAYRYGLKPKGNVRDDPHGDLQGKNILFIAHSIEETAQKFNTSAQQVEAVLADVKIKLLDARSRRSRPHLDDKILTAWNGLMISAMARAYQILGDDRYLASARGAAEFIRQHLYIPSSKQLCRRWRDNEAGIPGLASDYSFLIQGLIDLYESDFDPNWLDWAVTLAEKQLKLFFDNENGGFFMTHAEHDRHLILRVKEDSDTPIPSAGAVAALNLLRLARFTQRPDFSGAAEKTLAAFGHRVNGYPQFAPHMLVAMVFASSPSFSWRIIK